MIENLKQELRELTALTGISSREDEVVRYMYHKFRETTDDVSVDMLGNVTAAFKSGRPDAQRILVFAHMDEVGLMVKKVESNGYLRLERLTAVNSHIIEGTVFHVRTHGGEPVKGIVGAKSHHFMSAADKSRVPELSELFLDIGCTSKEQVNALDITEGCVVSFAHSFTELSNDIVSTKSLDDRAGLLVMLELARHLKGSEFTADYYLVASVQEEFNIRGIMPAVRAVDADVAIGLDITPAGDTPDVCGVTDVRLGAGPAFTYLNYHGRGTLNGLVPNEALVHFLERTCENYGIPYQREVCRGLLTETAYVAISGSKGVATASVSIPTRYAHTPVETASLKDIQSTISLFTHFTDTWDSSCCLKKICL
ncbi:MAG TPA: M20/M25/M40 family metallo-hydrolase [Feifaniaceae bacterium]|nr:M20/M25/M40 family metallo-hydrolase [Feifaniaceae bacterium]